MSPLISVPEHLAIALVEDRFPRERHPAAPHLLDWSRRWAVDRGLMSAEKAREHPDLHSFTDLVAGYYLGASWEVLAAISDLSVWFFAWDDRHLDDFTLRLDENWRRLDLDLRAVLAAPECYLDHSDPVVTGFADCMSRLLGSLGTAWDARFVWHFESVLDAYDREYWQRAAGRVLTTDEFVEQRRWTFGHWVWIDLLELTAGGALPARVRNSMPYQEMTVACQDFAAWYNDLCSLPKEVAVGEVHNLGIVSMHQDKLTQEQACADLRERVTGCVVRFLQAEPRLRAQLRHEQTDIAVTAMACMRNVRNWFSAVYWFHHESSRYRTSSTVT